uniref:Centrosomal protein 131 n=1 Tax=Sciurus vulgaris TaxID=55149 RepID=A0A8D2CT23_SCIVU
MKGSRATGGAPEDNPEGVDLSLTGLPLPMSRRPSSASTAKPVVRSISVATGSSTRRKALEATGPGGSRAINNLRRSNSTTQVSQPWTSSTRPAEPTDFLTLFEGDPGGRSLASLPKPCRGKGATWNVLDDQPRAFASPASAHSSSTLNCPVGPRRRECSLAPSFTANNRYSKGAVGNCVTSMVHNHYSPSEKAPPSKSSNQMAPSLNNIIKAATSEGSEGSSFRKPRKNVSTDHMVQGTPGGTAANLLRRKEVTEEEAERFIHQVNQAAVTIQRWYRHQMQCRRAGVTSLGHLLASTREGQQQLGGGNLLDLHRQKEVARRKAREEKARQARQAAIQELRQKRAQKSGKAEHGLPKESPETRAAGQPRHPPGLSLTPGSDTYQPPKANNTDILSQDVTSEDVETVGPTRSRIKSRATLDELLDMLKLLEEDPEYAWSDEDSASSLTADKLERFGKLSAPHSPPEDGMLLSEAKLQSVMSFLDEMEKSGQGQPSPQRKVSPQLAPEGSVSVMRLKLEVEEQKQAVVLLQRALAQQRDLTVRRVRETEKELRRQLRQQKEQYEATIQRHLTFIDQLIEDKKVLSGKCEAMVAELKRGDQQSRERVAQMQEQHQLEIKKLKELMSATEKVRREKWISEKTKKIKEITVRGLEPEIQKLIAKHKQEVRRLRGLHEAELLQREEQAAQRCLRQAEDLREQLEREKEALGQRERERAQRRLEQHLEQEQRALERQRQRLSSEVAEERERLGQQAARQRAELEELRQQLQDSSAALTRALRAEFEKGREEQERRHQVPCPALSLVSGGTRVWVSCLSPQEVWQLNRERELKEEIRKGRDQEIELVIHRLEADMTLAKEESERAAESRIKRVRDQYEAELSELEQSRRELQERCAELKGRLGAAEQEQERLQALVWQREKELADLRAVNAELSSERGSLAEVVHQEFADRLAASEEENRRVKAELAELQARQQLELDEAAMKRADHLEELLEQHRRPPPTAQ